MKSPDAPFLELGFYFSRIRGNSALEMLVRHLLERGAVAKVAYTTHTTNSPVAGFDIQLQEHRIDRSRTVLELLRNNDLTITKVVIEKGTKIVPNKREFVVQLPIDKKSIKNDHNPVAVWLEGEALSHTPTNSLPTKARRVGEKAFKTFREMVISLNPTYGAITVDYGLECPTDLRLDPRTYAFSDFYVATESVGEQGISLIRQLCPDAYHEKTPEGQITCCSGYFAPIETNVESTTVHELSEKVGKLISSQLAIRAR